MTPEPSAFLAAALEAAEACGVRTWIFRQPTEGEAFDHFARTRKRHVVCPRPQGVTSLYHWFVACAHVRYQHWSRRMVYRQEYRAVRFALDELALRGFEVPPRLRQRACDHVAQHLDSAMDRARRWKRVTSGRRWGEVDAWLARLRAQDDEATRAEEVKV